MNLQPPDEWMRMANDRIAEAQSAAAVGSEDPTAQSQGGPRTRGAERARILYPDLQEQANSGRPVARSGSRYVYAPGSVPLPDSFRFRITHRALLSMSALALMLVPFCLWAALANEAIVVWALDQRIASESVTRTLPALVKDASLVATAVCLVAGWWIYAWAGSLLYKVPPIRWLVSATARRLAPVVDALALILGALRHAAFLTCRALTALVATGTGAFASVTGRVLDLVRRGFALVAKGVSELLALGKQILAWAWRPIARLAMHAATLGKALAAFGRRTLAFVALPVRTLGQAVVRVERHVVEVVRALRLTAVRRLRAVRDAAVILAQTGAGAVRRRVRAAYQAATSIVAGLAALANVVILSPLRSAATTVAALGAGSLARIGAAGAGLADLMAARVVAIAQPLSRVMGVGAQVLGLTARAVSGVCSAIISRFVRLISAARTGLGGILALFCRPFTTAFVAVAGWAGHLVLLVAKELLASWAIVVGRLREARRLIAAMLTATNMLAAGVTRGCLAAISAAGRLLWRLIEPVLRLLAVLIFGITLLVVVPAQWVWRALRTTGRNASASAVAIGRGLVAVFSPAAELLASAASRTGRVLATAASLAAALTTGYLQGLAEAGRWMVSVLGLPIRELWLGMVTVRDIWRAASWMLEHGKWSPEAAGLSINGRRLAAAGYCGIGLVAVSLGAISAASCLITEEPTVTVVHWSTGHLLRDGSGLRLLPQMAAEFNAADHRTSSGKRIKIEVYYQGGAEQSAELISRLTTGNRVTKTLPDATLVTPSASHWLVNVNYAVGRDVVDLRDTDSRSLARSYVGIVTYRDMAVCLGWPELQIGYADIIALRDDPRGWSAYPCAKAEWGERPLVAFTDPSTSDTGRAVLLTVYAIAAGKRPEDLTSGDIEDPEVVAYVRKFQSLVDHYMIGTIPLNTKIYQGPGYGHFFIMPEDNLLHLYDGSEKVFENGLEVHAPPMSRDMVLIYPREGALLRENCACLVHAPWVGEEEEEAADQWVSYLLQEAQQRSFADAGFRAGIGTQFPVPALIRGRVSDAPPEVVLHAERVDPGLASAIDASWDLVKRPAVVSFVVDTSGSMLGRKLARVKDGLRLALESMAPNNQVGLVTFGDKVENEVPVAPALQNVESMSGAIRRMTAQGETALYDAVKAGIEMVDAASVPHGAIRAVVVITDGRANRGRVGLDNLVSMMSTSEVPILRFRGFEDDVAETARGGVRVEDVVGLNLALKTREPVQIFFIAIGKDADLNIGRILAGATGAEFQGVTEQDLAEVLAQFSKYF